MAAATRMTISLTLAVVVVLLCAASLVATSAAGGHHPEANKASDLVAKTCANVTRRHYKGPGLTRQFCESALRSDKRSVVARDARDLALVAMDLVQRGAVRAGAKVDDALRSGTTAKWSLDTMVDLHYCQQDHNDVARTAPECRALVQEYDPPGHPGDGEYNPPGRPKIGHNMIAFVYLECANRLMHAAHDCWLHTYYQDREAKKAVWKEAVEVASQANLAKAMVEQMLNVVDHNDDH